MGLYCASDIYTDTYGSHTLERYRRRMHDYEAFVHNIMCAHFFVLSSNDTDPMRAPVSCLSSLLIISAALVMRRYRVVSLHIAAITLNQKGSPRPSDHLTHNCTFFCNRVRSCRGNRQGPRTIVLMYGGLNRGFYFCQILN